MRSSVLCLVSDGGEGGGAPCRNLLEPSHEGGNVVPSQDSALPVHWQLHTLQVAVGVVVVLTRPTQSIVGHLGDICH